ncbi:FAR1 DNA binding domain [Dillenia turbinata]|uniref:Protein FAR1-RELATED SEQUENCE n=1 Tax=Dillenia turbinata TaxID=194707 RepID=A0AAN8Z9Q5_9MAGN
MRGGFSKGVPAFCKRIDLLTQTNWFSMYEKLLDLSKYCMFLAVNSLGSGIVVSAADMLPGGGGGGAEETDGTSDASKVESNMQQHGRTSDEEGHAENEVEMGSHLNNDEGIESPKMGVSSNSGMDLMLVEVGNYQSVDEVVEAPKSGMTFDSLDDLIEYYRSFGKQEGFGIRRRTASNSFDGKSKFVTIACNRAGKSESKRWNHLNPSPTARTECKARINATVWEAGNCRINSVVLDHNHPLSPSKGSFELSNRRGRRRKIESDEQVGIRMNKKFQTFGDLEKEREALPWKAGWLLLGEGDAEALNSFFDRMQKSDPGFFYLIGFDEYARIRGIFWADGRSRAAYEEFGDVVMFDTTYLTNDYAIPLSPFVGVNHHGQTILLGCGLIANEDTETFVWLFKAWLSSVSGRAPNAIITDQDKAIQEAVQNVIPNSRHRWCLWHIMKRLPEKVKEYDSAEQIKVAFVNVVYDSLTKDEFVDGWKNFIKEFNLQENEWLNGLYEERHRWVPACVKDAFWAGLSTTKKGETMNTFFDGYVNSRTTLKQFVEQYDQALKFRVEREAQSDFHSYSLRIACITHFEIEKQFQAIYTIPKFKEVQLELTGTMYCDILSSNEGDGLGEYSVQDELEAGGKIKYAIFQVEFKENSCEVRCSCCLFEFRGILCRHAMKVLARRKIIKVPEKYIVSRWRKDLKRQYTRVKTSYNDLSNYPDARRHDMMQQMFEEVATLAMEFDDKSRTVISCLSELKERLIVNPVSWDSSQRTSCVEAADTSH